MPATGDQILIVIHSFAVSKDADGAYLKELYSRESVKKTNHMLLLLVAKGEKHKDNQNKDNGTRCQCDRNCRGFGHGLIVYFLCGGRVHFY